MHSAVPMSQADYERILEAEGMPAELPSVFTSDVVQFTPDASDALDKAGVDDSTDSATFMEMNGRNIWVETEGLGYEATEGVMASLS